MSEELRAEVDGYRADVDLQVQRISALLVQLRESASSLVQVSAGSSGDQLESAARSIALSEQLLVDFVGSSSVAVDLLHDWAHRV